MGPSTKRATGSISAMPVMGMVPGWAIACPSASDSPRSLTSWAKRMAVAQPRLKPVVAAPMSARVAPLFSFK